MSAWFLFFFLSVCHCETKTCAVCHTTQRACQEISVYGFFQGHNEVMPSEGIELATLQSLARRSNQLSYGATKY